MSKAEVFSLERIDNAEIYSEVEVAASIDMIYFSVP